MRVYERKVKNLKITDALEVLITSFCHLNFEENIWIGTLEILLYFPSIGIAIMESSPEKSTFINDKLENISEYMIRKKLNAEVIYLDVDDEDFCIGLIINELLLKAGFVPSSKKLTDSKQ